MSKAIKRIKQYGETYDLSSEQQLYLIYASYKLSYPISVNSLLELIDKNILTAQGDFTEDFAKIKVADINNTELNVNMPTFDSEISLLTFRKLKNAVCYKDRLTGKPVSVNADNMSDKMLEQHKESVLTVLKGRGVYADVYNTFLALFPSLSIEHNTRWKAFFKSSYSGISLRIKGRDNAKKFMALINQNDAGVVLYATFLYINNGIKPSSTFIGSQTRFYDEAEEWISQAMAAFEKIKDKDIKPLFVKAGKKQDFIGGIQL